MDVSEWQNVALRNQMKISCLVVVHDAIKREKRRRWIGDLFISRNRPLALPPRTAWFYCINSFVVNNETWTIADQGLFVYPLNVTHLCLLCMSFRSNDSWEDKSATQGIRYNHLVIAIVLGKYYSRRILSCHLSVKHLIVSSVNGCTAVRPNWFSLPQFISQARVKRSVYKVNDC